MKWSGPASRSSRLSAEFWPASKTTVRPSSALADRPEALDQFVDHVGELGGVVAVPLIGVADQRDATVDGDHEPQTDQSQVVSLLLGLAPLGDGGTVVGRIDEGGEVRHVEREPRDVDLVGLDHALGDPALDLDQLRRG